MLHSWRLSQRSVPANGFSPQELLNLGLSSLAIEIIKVHRNHTQNSSLYLVPYSRLLPDHDDDHADFDRNGLSFFSSILSAEQIPEDEGMMDEMLSFSRVIIYRGGIRKNLLSASVPSMVVQAFFYSPSPPSSSSSTLNRALEESMQVVNIFRRPVAASKSSIEALEKMVIVDEGSSSMDQCMICLEKFDVGLEVVTRMPCLHIYHEDCIVPWLQTSHFCPVCRFQMPT